MVVAIRRDPRGKWRRQQNGDRTRLRIYRAIVRHNEEVGISPSVRELCTLTGVKSTSTISYHLKALNEDGRIIWHQGMARGIALPKEMP